MSFDFDGPLKFVRLLTVTHFLTDPPPQKKKCSIFLLQEENVYIIKREIFEIFFKKCPFEMVD